MKNVILVFSIINGLWGFYIALHLLRAMRGRMTARIALHAAIDVLWGLSAFLSALALSNLLDPLVFKLWGISYWLMVPVPCYFNIFKRGPRGRFVRNAFMVVMGALIFTAV
ncbi:MAG: hypothetical protein A2583_07840 [Bdellovibrionales bacterium RIFOXYD1_FULL_53_11]|nr:MAG: hypothetical protein A2583_07840 [Bdellovibrionales bacterium RIFOXYD1_FULL_53_11]